MTEEWKHSQLFCFGDGRIRHAARALLDPKPNTFATRFDIYPITSIMSNGAGIQELMAAETRASQIVAEARIGKRLECGRGKVEKDDKELILLAVVGVVCVVRIGVSLDP